MYPILALFFARKLSARHAGRRKQIRHPLRIPYRHLRRVDGADEIVGRQRCRARCFAFDKTRCQTALKDGRRKSPFRCQYERFRQPTRHFGRGNAVRYQGSATPRPNGQRRIFLGNVLRAQRHVLTDFALFPRRRPRRHAERQPHRYYFAHLPCHGLFHRARRIVDHARLSKKSRRQKAHFSPFSP